MDGGCASREDFRLPGGGQAHRQHADARGPDQFEEQMADLAARGFRSVRLDRFQEGEGRTVLITFDDAYAHVSAVVTPILERHGFSATMFVPTAYLGRPNAWDAAEHPRLGA